MTQAVNIQRLIRDISTRSARAMLSQLGLRSQALRNHLRDLYDQEPGSPGAILADPVLEATFGWATAGEDMVALSARGLLSEDLIAAMDTPPPELREEYSFPIDRNPFTHQLASWEYLLADDPRSVLVTSGTGSGKTECFLIPILESLVRERVRAGHVNGVHALLLYPLNALINSQRDRLRAWTSSLGNDIRFCLYNGETPERDTGADRRFARSEQLSRQQLREDPAPILVTNSTMLEYMLVRTEDQPIIDQSRGKLRWIVLDEAHSYMGSQAADLALLLRRVMHRFDVSPGEVRFVATSATIGGPNAANELQRFLADVSGMDRSHVHVITGQRGVPSLDAVADDVSYPPSTDEPAQMYAALRNHPPAVALRKRLSEGPAKLSDLESVTSLDRAELSELITKTSTAQHDGRHFAPVRAHVFHRTQSGLWACVNAECSDRTAQQQDDNWPFGAVYHERRDRCRGCSHPVYEIIVCLECGQDYLSASEWFDVTSGTTELRQFGETADVDEFRLEVDADAGEEEPDASQSPEDQRLICPHGLSSADSVESSLQPRSRHLGNAANTGVRFQLLLPETASGQLVCARCHTRDRDRELFRALRIGAPFALSTIIPTALENTPPKRLGTKLPSDGRRILGFTDSRQGSARLAVRLQQEAERNRVRSVLYHALVAERPARDEDLAARTREQLNALGESSALDEIRENLEKKLAEAEGGGGLGSLTWTEAVDRLTNDSSLRMMHTEFKRTSHIEFDLAHYADFCLYREFFRRPKRMNSAETLGLIAVRYPQLDNARAPNAWPLDADDWQNFLKLILDFFARSNGAADVDDRYLNWMGGSVRKNYIQGPETVGTPLTQGQVRWPGIRRAPMGRLPRLLLKAADMAPSDDTCDLVNDLFNRAWDQIVPMLQQYPDGYVLKMKEAAALSEPHSGAICPYTARSLDTTLKRLSPYLPPGSTVELAVQYAVPRIPRAYWVDEGGRTANADEVADWLESDDNVKAARALGIWSSLNDRVAADSPYYAVAEHSAQISGQRQRELETRFKDGRLNVLSCSTTMEMGVDIGGLSAVVMNNAPPSSANYLQRAGRAGRRGEGASFCVTLCPSNPHGELVFRDPMWPFKDHMAVPRVTLDSKRLVQRHVNSMCLSSFLQERDVRRLRAGWFFDNDENGTSPAAEFVEFCRNGTTDNPLEHGLSSLVRGSVLADVAPTKLRGASGDAMQAALEQWRADVDALREDAERMRADDPDSRLPEVVAIERQLDRIEKEFLLRELVNCRFLPGYGFPTGVVAFVPLTIDDIRARKEESGQREESFGTKQGFPSREVSHAIREYAPGAEVVVDGRVYESSGVTLNWHTPAGAQDFAETQAIGRVWYCGQCGANGSGRTDPQFCPSCNADASHLSYRKFLEPAGFAVDISSHAHNNVVSPRYIPVEDPLISCPTPDWIAFGNSHIGRFRYTDMGHIFHGNRGISRHGYAICLRCGRAASEDGPPGVARVPSVFQTDHRRLRGGRDPEGRSRCDGSDHTFAIQRGITLGSSRTTGVFELQLHGVRSNGAAVSLGIALRRAFTQHLGIEEREVGVVARPGQAADGSRTQSIFLFDASSGGNGYVAALRDDAAASLRDARSVLKCVNDCDAACHGCLLNYSTQFSANELNRHEALACLSDELLDGLRLPPNRRYLGDGSRVLNRPLARHIAEVAGQPSAEEIYLYLGGDADSWDVPEFPLHDSALRWVVGGRRVHLVVDPQTWRGLSDGNRHVLASLVDATNDNLQAHVEAAPTAALSPARVLATISGPGLSISWAADTAEVDTSMCADWGRDSDGASIVFSTVAQPAPSISGPSVPVEDLRPTPQGTTTTLAISDELNGVASGFGLRFWQLVLEHCPGLIRKIASSGMIERVGYCDRYLKSPWTMLLLREVVAQLTSLDGAVDATTKLQVLTRELDMSHAYGRQPRLVEHEWHDEHLRQAFFRQVLDTGGLRWPGPVSINANRQVPHFRELSLEWSDGTNWSMKFDQGFGYWWCGSRSGARDFPFQDSREQARRADDLMQVVTVTTNQPHPTYVYIAEGDSVQAPSV